MRPGGIRTGRLAFDDLFAPHHGLLGIELFQRTLHLTEIQVRIDLHEGVAGADDTFQQGLGLLAEIGFDLLLQFVLR